MGRLTALIVVVAFAGCSVPPGDPYPMPSGPPHAGATLPLVVGMKGPQVVLWLSPRPGDRIELLGAEPIGVGKGAEVRILLSRPIRAPNGDWLIGEQLESLAGAVVSNDTTTVGPQTQVGIVAEITARQPGRYQLTGIRLHYRLNGGTERVGEGIDVIFTVSAADPAPSACEA